MDTLNTPFCGSMSLLDRGDAPAQIVIDKTTRSMAKRRAEETQYELNKIHNRVDMTMAAFELNEKLMEENKATYFVPDLIELERIISDTIQKKKYQQQVMVFVVGFESNATARVKLLTQINEFFNTHSSNLEEEFNAPPQEFELEELSSKVQDALETADTASKRLQEINQEMVRYVVAMGGGKAASKSKKKLEKALLQAKEDIMSLTDKLLGAQTEIEDKEDQMTKLYRQIDVKTLEIQRLKHASEMAKKNLTEVDVLKEEVKDKEDEIVLLQRQISDLQLSLQQVEHTREHTIAKLKATNEQQELAINKLENKFSGSQVVFEDTRKGLQKQHDLEIAKLNKEHEEEVEKIKQEYTEKLDQIEEEHNGSGISKASSSTSSMPSSPTLSSSSSSSSSSRRSSTSSGENSVNRVRSWASDSDDEQDSLGVSRQSTNISQKRSSNLRKKESTFGSSSIKKVSLKTSAPSTPKEGSLKSVQTKDLDGSKSSTPRKVSRTKSNLEPVSEIPFEDKFALEDEQKWVQVPPEQLSSAFKHYRGESLMVIRGLSNELKTVKEEHHTRVKKLRSQLIDRQQKWDSERQVLTVQVEQAQKLQNDAEKEADGAMAQLEDIVNEQAKLVEFAEISEAGEVTLTVRKGEMSSTYVQTDPNVDEKSDKIKVEDGTEASADSISIQLNSREVTAVDSIPRHHPLYNLLTSDLDISDFLLKKLFKEYVDVDTQTEPLIVNDAVSYPEKEVEQFDQISQAHSEVISPHFSVSMSHDNDQQTAALWVSNLATGNASEYESERPFSASSQRSMYEKYKAELEQRKADIVERRSKGTSMHGSLLSASRPVTATTNTTIPGMLENEGEVTKVDIATSPYSFSSSSLSKLSLAAKENPVISDYLKTYDFINEFKDSLIQLFSDKEMMSASEQLSDLKMMPFSDEKNIQNQIEEMTLNTHHFLKEATYIINAVFHSPYEPAVSSLLSRGDTFRSILPSKSSKSTSMDRERSMLNIEREPSMATTIDGDHAKELQLENEQLKKDSQKQREEYEEKLNHNTVVMMEMQDMIQELQRELGALNGSSKPVSRASLYDIEQTIIFSRLDFERNQKNLKRAVRSDRISAERYNEVVRTMDEYVKIPKQRLENLVKKYTHHTNMKAIEANVRNSGGLDDEVFKLLERMEALQSKRAQRWGDDMDKLAEERQMLANLLMETLSMIEEESGIFMIKPILSWKGRGWIPSYPQRSSSIRSHERLTSNRTITPRNSTPFNFAPAPTPASFHRMKSARPPSQGGEFATKISNDVAVPVGSKDVAVKGETVTLLGNTQQPMWAMTSSVPRPTANNGDVTNSLSLLHTPKLLELDVNRLLIGQNIVSAATKSLLSNDRLINAANSSVRSYVSVPRLAMSQTGELKQSRPHSTGVSSDQKKVSIPESRSIIPPATSNNRLSPVQPLPPIKVPSDERQQPITEESEDEQDRPITVGSYQAHSKAMSYPSPPQTPPGSSLRHSVLQSPYSDHDITEPRPSTPGHVTRITTRSVSQSSTRNMTPEGLSVKM
ncbi:uncharacterized protein [Antedon mediterranea]|uniref:uncharacterized protein isoform X2 n=1 Tax=Antedon mediterranea TaxID=105859 RepID=UPI003AF719E0